MSDLLVSLKRAAADPKRNGEGWYCCDCGELLGEAAAEIERLQRLLDRITDGAEWCGLVLPDVAANVCLWHLPQCDGRRGDSLIEAAAAAKTAEVAPATGRARLYPDGFAPPPVDSWADNAAERSEP